MLLLLFGIDLFVCPLPFYMTKRECSGTDSRVPVRSIFFEKTSTNTTLNPKFDKRPATTCYIKREMNDTRTPK